MGGFEFVDGLLMFGIQSGCTVANGPSALLINLSLIGLAVSVVLCLSLSKLLLPLAVVLHVLALLYVQFLPESTDVLISIHLGQ